MSGVGSSGKVVQEQKALALSTTSEDLEKAGKRLRDGGLVAFPTETVYGLGANALDEAAVRSIFTTKGRPLNDPLIVHVPAPDAALELLQLGNDIEPLYRYLATAFWPGPLTLVGRAHESIPLTVTAGTGMVGIRCPNHPVARRLLEAAKVPVAAPSANRFGHVSPTSASHVLQDLGQHDIFVVDGGMVGRGDDGGGGGSATDCSVGIESTVAKIDAVEKKIILFRRGGISQAQLESALRQGPFSDFSVEVRAKVVIHKEEEVGLKGVGEEAPGQHLTHYAPDVPATLLKVVGKDRAADGIVVDETPTDTVWKESVVLDFGGALKSLEPKCLGYRDLSPAGDMDEAANQLFAALRWSESIDGATRVFVLDIDETSNNHAHRDAVKDRLFRSASGRSMTIFL